MSGAFKYRTEFNGDISGWDTSSVTNMEFMFFNATNFVADLSRWSGEATQVAQKGMFYFALSFAKKYIVRIKFLDL